VHAEIRRYLDGAAAAGFVIVWTTLGFETALFAALAAIAVVQAPRLATLKLRRPAPPRPRAPKRRPPAWFGWCFSPAPRTRPRG